MNWLRLVPGLGIQTSREDSFDSRSPIRWRYIWFRGRVIGDYTGPRRDFRFHLHLVLLHLTLAPDSWIIGVGPRHSLWLKASTHGDVLWWSVAGHYGPSLHRIKWYRCPFFSFKRWTFGYISGEVFNWWDWGFGFGPVHFIHRFNKAIRCAS